MKRRTVIVTTSFPHDDGDASGHFVHAHALALAKSGCEVHVIAPYSSRAGGAGTRFAVHPAGGSSVFQWPGALARLRAHPWRVPAVASFALGVRRQLRRHGPFEHAVAHWLLPSMWPLLNGVDASLEAVCHGADVRLLMTFPASIRERIIRKLVQREVQFTFVAERLRRQLVDGLRPPTATALWEHSVVQAPLVSLPPEHQRSSQATRIQLGLGKNEPFVVLIGRLVPSKRLSLGLEAIAQLPSRPRTVIVGDGPDQEHLKTLSNQLGLNVTFTGRLARHRALGVMSAASVLLHPSGIEAAPTAILEARKLGTAVVACPAGDLERWAEHDPCLRLATPDAQSLATALKHAVPAWA